MFCNSEFRIKPPASTTTCCTMPDVVNEIKDKATKQRLQVLPYELKYKEPTTEVIKTVTDFSKKTGDYRSLSAVDIKVIALTLQLEQENVGKDHIKTEPERKVVWTASTKTLEKHTDIAGFYLKKSTENDQTKSRTQSESNSTDRDEEDKMAEEDITTDTISIDKQDGGTETSSVNKDVELEFTRSVDESELQMEDGDDESDEDDDDDGWIKPSNIRQIKEEMGDVNNEKATVPVGCVTTDFSVQNVLLQMGLNVISVDGMLIKRTKNYVLRCHACMKLTTNMTKEFCPHCGNKSLQRVSMTVNEDGSIQYFLSRRKPVSTKGMRYSLPAPKGGKHANNPILCEDQREAQQRAAKASKERFGMFDQDYVANSSPFALNDVTSRAAQLGIGRRAKKGAKNPNESHKKRGRRK